MYDLAIVGGGILGTFHAYHALRRGLRVVLLERDAEPSQASVRNFGQCVPSGMNLKWQSYGRRSLEIYKSMQQRFDLGVRENGSVYLASNEEELQLLHELAAINKANDYCSKLLTKSECLAQYPGLRSDYVVGGLLFPEEVSLEPRKATKSIIKFLRESFDLDYKPHHTVVAIDADDKRATLRTSHRTEDNAIHAEHVIVCSGHDFQTLYPELFAASDLEAVKLQMLETVDQSQQFIHGNLLTGLSIRRYEAFSECPSWADVKSKEPAESFAKKWGVHILFKQTTTGSFIIGDSHEYADASESDRLGFDIRVDVQDFLLSEARKILDLKSYEVKRHWYGVYSQCKEQDIFNHHVHERIRIVTGIGGKGMTASGGYAEETIENLFGPASSGRALPTKPKIELVVFDMAGTTVDEDNIVYKTLHRAILNQGVTTDLNTVLLHGAGKEKLQAARDVIEAVLGQPNEGLALAAFSQFQVMLDQAYATEPIREQPHASQVFEFLKTKCIKVALNTGYSRQVTNFLIARLGWSDSPLIDAVVCADDVQRGRPHPDMIELAMQRCGVTDPKKVAKIGDSGIDIDEGKNAGCGLTFGITTGAQLREQLLLATPNAILSSLAELQDWISRD
jgi:FAD dependent oxidoreductase TIGR03364/phosphonatase-like hydrolase